jgi:hypothetical protein
LCKQLRLLAMIMALLTVKPTRLDEGIARQVAAHTDRRVERVAGVATWGADEHILLGLAAVGWLLTRNAPNADRELGNHFLICSLTSAVLPHIMKRFIDQERPDRLTFEGHMRGIPFGQIGRRLSFRPRFACGSFGVCCDFDATALP